MEVHPPSLEQILLKYFNQNSISSISKDFNNYKGCKIQLKATNEKGIASFKVYIPSTLKINIFHKDYRFTSQKIKFNESTEKTIKLSEIK